MGQTTPAGRFAKPRPSPVKGLWFIEVVRGCSEVSRMRGVRWLGVLICMTGAAWAQQVYKSVDDTGKVIFSDKPPANAESVTPVTIKPGPSEASVRETVERQRAISQAAGKLGGGEVATDGRSGQASGIQDAKALLAEAERQLDEARQIGPGDRKGTAGGGSRLSEQYRQRVEAAEAAVDAARQRLQQARRGGAPQ